jgi:hypothetical protein
VSRGARITGVLQDDAMIGFLPGTSDSPHAVLSFEVQAEKGLPYVVRKPLGTDPTVHNCARSTASLLKRGCEVAFYAQGFRAQSDHGHACLMALGVTDVLPLDIPSPRTNQEA